MIRGFRRKVPTGYFAKSVTRAVAMRGTGTWGLSGLLGEVHWYL